MSEPEYVSNWKAASAEVSCPKCGAANRPSATYCERQQDGSYVCGVCAHPFRWPPSATVGQPGK